MSMQRANISSGGPFEAKVGYSRAVRVGHHVWVAGSTAMTPGGLVGRGDAYAQAKQALTTIQRALEQAGSRLDHVVRTRMFVTDISQWEAIARAHAEFLGTIRPATTLVEVSKLIDRKCSWRSRQTRTSSERHPDGHPFRALRCE